MLLELIANVYNCVNCHDNIHFCPLYKFIETYFLQVSSQKFSLICIDRNLLDATNCMIVPPTLRVDQITELVAVTKH